jgi:hypothetical protein
MKKTLLTLSLLAGASLAQAADGWQFLPIVNDPGYKAQPTLALSVDRVNPKNDGVPSDTATGLEFNFNCGLVQSPDKRIRTAVKFSRSSQNDLKVTSFELSPRYMVPVGNGVTLGAGPSLTSVRLSEAGDGRTLWGAGLAASAEWRSGAMFLGADLRWHDLRKKDGVEYDNTAIGLRVGVNF